MPPVSSALRWVARLSRTAGPEPRRTAGGPSRIAVVALAFVVAVGLVARVHFYLSAPSYWYDEAYLLLNLFGRSFGELLGAIDHAQAAPPGFLWLERAVYLALGPGERAMRLPAFVAGLAALAVMVPLARAVVGGRAAWLAVALVALSRSALRHGGEVKPYVFDLLASELVLLLVVVYVRARAAGASGRLAGLGLLAAAFAGPWLSFTSAFALGGAVAGLFLHARRGDGRSRGLFAAVALVAGASGLVLWWVHARHLYYPVMAGHWGPGGEGGFPDWRSPVAVLLWPVRCVVSAAGYGTREMGIPLTILAAVGVRRLVRQEAAVAAALALPIALAVVASCLGKYPLANRTTMCLLPGLWLAAAAGVAELADRFPARRVVLLLSLVVLAPDVANGCAAAVRPLAFPEGRSAFRDVRAARAPGDVVWVSHAEVYHVYHGREGDVFGAADPPAGALERAATGRIWVIEYQSPFRSPTTAFVEALAAAGYREADRRQYRGGVVVRCYLRG